MNKPVSFLSATILGAALTLSFSSASFANSSNYAGSTSTNTAHSSSSYGRQGNGVSNFYGTDRPTNFASAHSSTIGNASDTASFYYKTGVRHFEKGSLDKAEYAFKAVLRANGLNSEANYYLARINQKQGDEARAFEYAKAYQGLK